MQYLIKFLEVMGESEEAIIPLFSNRGYMDPLRFSLKIGTSYSIIMV